LYFFDNAAMDFAPNPDLKELYRRVIADPVSTTRADRNAVFRLPAADEEVLLCVANTGSTLAELRQRALAEPEKRTLDETKILSSPWSVLNHQWKALGSDDRKKRLKRQLEDTSALKALADEAELKLLAVEAQEERAASVNAIKRQ
jgi:ABC-type phosphate transport system auxiliary subunit